MIQTFPVPRNLEDTDLQTAKNGEVSFCSCGATEEQGHTFGCISDQMARRKASTVSDDAAEAPATIQPGRPGTPTIVHVNRQHIGMNAKDGGNRPVYTVKCPDGTTRYAREVEFEGKTRAVYDGRQLRCGARAWLETEFPVTLIDEMSFQEARAAV